MRALYNINKGLLFILFILLLTAVFSGSALLFFAMGQALLGIYQLMLSLVFFFNFLGKYRSNPFGIHLLASIVYFGIVVFMYLFLDNPSDYLETGILFVLPWSLVIYFTYCLYKFANK